MTKQQEPGAVVATCANCRFGKFAGMTVRSGYGAVRCQRRAPVIVTAERYSEGEWPMTDERAWCGDHEFASPTASSCG